jgi:hypothetical protein
MEVIYQNGDVFEVIWKKGDVGGFNNHLQSATERYGPSEPPDLGELATIVNSVYKWRDGTSGAWDIGYPVYPDDVHFWGLKRIVKGLARESERKKENAEANKQFFQGIMQRFREEQTKYVDDIMAR